MTTGATGQLGLALPVQGELSGTWGNTVNNAITEYTNIAIAATLTLTNDGAVTLANTTGSDTVTNIVSSLTGAGTVTAQFAIVKVTGTLTVAKVVTAPSYSKTYTVVNAATGGIVTFKAAGQTGVSIAVGESAFVYFNGTDYVKVSSTVATGVTSFTAGTTGLTPNTATTGAVTLAGTLGTANGGTNLGGATPFTANGVVYASSTSALATGSALNFDGTNVGVGVTPNTSTGSGNIQLGNVGNRWTWVGVEVNGAAILAMNTYYSAGNYKYAGSYAASMYLSDFGVHRWYNAPSGTAGNNISFTQAMTLDASGNLGIGTTSPTNKLQVSGSTSNVATIVTNTNTAGQASLSLATNQAALYSAAFGSTAGGTTWAGLTGDSQTVIEAQNSSSFVIGAFNNSAPIIFAQGRAEIARFSTAGGFSVGTVTDPGAGIIADANGNVRKVPQSGSAKTTSYTLAVGDVGEYILLGASGAIVIPDATFAAGDVVTIFNNTASTATITCSITTAYIAGTFTDKATMTLAAAGVATVLFITSTLCVVSGNVT